MKVQFQHKGSTYVQPKQEDFWLFVGVKPKSQVKVLGFTQTKDGNTNSYPWVLYNPTEH